LPATTLNGEPVSPSVAVQDCQAILQLTAEIFASNHVTVACEFDPEIVGKEYWVVSVKTQGELPDLLAKDSDWHHRIWEVAPETASYYCLSLGMS
jgi:hypothetical protein